MFSYVQTQYFRGPQIPFTDAFGEVLHDAVTDCIQQLPAPALWPPGGAVLPPGQGLREERGAGSDRPRPGGTGADGL